MKLKYEACLALNNGRLFYGSFVGKKGIACAEICFTVNSVGYQHSITDPSFAGQMILFTFPHIGNIGINSDDNESGKVFAEAIICREKPHAFCHYKKEFCLDDWMSTNGLVGMYGVDTRSITRFIAMEGNQNGIIFPTDELSPEEAMIELSNANTISNLELTYKVSGAALTISNSGDASKTVIYLVDFGVKSGIIRNLQRFFSVVIIEAKQGFSTNIPSNAAGVVLSNGPGDPVATYEYLKEDFIHLFSLNIPILGICLGHQITVIAFGCKTKKMPLGHRGGNHPVVNLENGKVEITSQNHGFVLDELTIRDNVIVTHRSLFDGSVEGVKIKNRKIMSVQYHPEGSPGPHDSSYIFEDFYTMVSSR